jgi:hypothetical protein
MSSPIQLIVDASPVGLGAVMVQFKPEGPRVVKYISRALKEMLKGDTPKQRKRLWVLCGHVRSYIYILMVRNLSSLLIINL